MASIVETLELISKTIDAILDFLASDTALSEDFQKYLEINNIEINSESQFNIVVMEYILDMKMQNGLHVLEYFRRNNQTYDEIINALKNSIVSVFKVNKILSNAYETTCLTSNADVTLIPMVKMSHLKQVGRYDFIKARIIELNNVQYILEIYDVISEFNVYGANSEAIRYMIQNPKCAYFKNEEKLIQLKSSAEEFYEKFVECFKTNYVITTNKKVDELIEYFNKYRLGEQASGYDDLIEHVEENKYIKIEELNCSDSCFLETAVGGFASHKETYDVALWMDKKRGMYIIPFFETFMKIFKQDIVGADDCIREFLTSDKIPPSVIKFASEQNPNFFEVINKTLNTNFNTLEEILFNTKAVFVDNGIYSPVTTLFNSDLFSTLIDITKKEEENDKKEEQIGRNEPCPCGSGLKYKNCCAKKE